MRIILATYLCYLTVFLTCNVCGGYKILMAMSSGAKSHRILGDSCVDLLLRAGHQVTYISCGASSLEPDKSLSTIDVCVPMAIGDSLNLQKYMNGELGFDNLHHLTTMTSEFQRNLLEHDKIQALLNNPKETFEVAILEWHYADYIVGLAGVFGCPYIWFSSMEPHPLILNLIGEIANPAYSALLTFKTVPPFTFMERVRSLKDLLSLYFHREYYLNPIEAREYERLIAPLIAKRHSVVPSYDELRYKGSLVLGNSHISVGRAVQLPAAYKSVGGFHMTKDSNPLPENLKIVLDNSVNGLIYFSMGSAVDCKDLPSEITKMVLQMFGGLKQTVLWKYSADLPDRPSNVHIVSWAPQQSILAHKNCVLFISHGGQLSTLEAVHYGVPLVGIPVFADQQANVKTLVKQGMAKQVDLHYGMVKDLKMAIEEILRNSSYARAAKHQSYIYHHRPVPPAVEMVYWVEHVVQTHGAAHLRSPGLLVPWYQKYYLDLAMLLFASVTLLYITTKRVLSSMQRKRAAKKKLE